MANFFVIKPTDALISQIYFCQETLYVSGSSCAHHQEFSTVNSALVSFTNCLTNHHGQFLFNKTNRRANFPNLFLSRNSICFGQFLCLSSGIIHSTFGTGKFHAALMTAFKQDGGRAWKLSSILHDIYQCRMYSGKLLMMGRGTARNM